jgi:Fic family protein
LRRLKDIITAYFAEIRKMYIYQHSQWPLFTWDSDVLSSLLARVRHKQGLLLGQMRSLGFSIQAETSFYILTQDIVKSSEIEGEHLDISQVRSSLAQRLGVDIGGLIPASRDIEGFVEIMLDATLNFEKPLTQERLLGWHAALFPTGYSGLSKILIGSWRTDHLGPMQVISGRIGREKVHFEAPPARDLPHQMTLFLEWLNGDLEIDPVLKAGLAHLWFVTLHPFEDGNGRIARVITDSLLARSEGSEQRFYSMSSQIRKEREAYYAVLEETQKECLEVTGWLKWFLECLERAIDGADATLSAVIEKSKFWEKAKGYCLNDRQRRILNKMLDGFEGNLTSSKWAKLGKCSSDTALRDITELVHQGLLMKKGEGRSTHYVLILN